MTAAAPRPSPEALLAEAGRSERLRPVGRLKIFLGAAPGVGKTFEMLTAAHRKVAEGIDVVAGIVETHGRVETGSLLQGLPQIPRRQIEYRGRMLDELDLDAMLARKPGLALIDELAHTNVTGSRHARRYQDVQELLDAGIDVWTTLNVQHIESFTDLVMRITGVEIRETVPDTFIDAAHDVELIDLPPDDLAERLRQGKVYVPEQAKRALDNYFSRGNLLALRELALRAAAEHVDDDLTTFMRAHAIAGPWPARGRVIVCIDASPASEHLVRAAQRLADQRHLPWTVIYVQTLGSATGGQLDLTLALASQLGADTTILTANRVGEAIVDYARTHNAAQIIIGRSQSTSHRVWLRRNLAQWLFVNAHEFEITVVSADHADGARASTVISPGSSWMSWRDVYIAIGCSLGATGISAMLEPWAGTGNLALLFLLGVTFAGASGGLASAVLGSVTSFLLYNYLFTEPRLSLDVSQPQDLATLVVFLAVSLIVGQLAGRLRRQAHDAWLATRRVETLFNFSRRLSTAIDERDLRNAAGQGIGELLGRRCVVLRPASEQRVEAPEDFVRKREFGDTDHAAADWSFTHREPSGHGTGTLPASSWYCLPVAESERPLGVIAVHLPGSNDVVSAEQNRLLFSLQAQLAAAWERLRLRRVMQEGQLQRATDSLRAALLASVSHDLRTPLVSITGSLTALRDLAASMPEKDRSALLEAAISAAARLDRLIQNLLDMTRLTHGALRLSMVAVDVRDVVSESISRATGLLKDHETVMAIPVDVPAVGADRTLLSQILVNLIENATKFAPPGTEIRIAARRDGADVCIDVIDRGPGIPAADRDRVFDMFYRIDEHENRQGSGLGLAICKGFVEAMGGTIQVLAGADATGTAISVRLTAAHNESRDTAA